MAKLEEQYDSSRKLREFSEQLVSEKKRWREYQQKIEADIDECRDLLRDFHKVLTGHEKVLEAFMAEVDNIKKLKRLTELTEQMVKEMQE